MVQENLFQGSTESLGSTSMLPRRVCLFVWDYLENYWMYFVLDSE